jgi:hypothetical protein
MNVVAEFANLVLAVVFWATLGRILLTRIALGRDNFFLGVLRKATEPAYVVVGRVLPQNWVPFGVLILALVLRWALLPYLKAA